MHMICFYMIFNGSISLKPNLELAEGMKDWLVWLRILPTVILSFGLTMSSSEELCTSGNLGPQKLCNNYNRLKVSLATSVVFLYDFVHEVDDFSIETHALGVPHVRKPPRTAMAGPCLPLAKNSPCFDLCTWHLQQHHADKARSYCRLSWFSAAERWYNWDLSWGKWGQHMDWKSGKNHIKSWDIMW